jgi:hypothetical protein
VNTQSKYTVLRSLGLVLLMAVLVFGGIGITGAAAQAAIPGDALYPVKSTIEQTRLAFAADAGARAELRLGYAENRLEEIQALISEGRYREVSPAVLAFEADLNGAILELDTISRFDPARGSQIALEITSALSRFAQSLSVMAAGAPESVRSDVARALDTTGLAGSLELQTIGSLSGEDSNANANLNGDDNSNVNDDDCSGNGDDGANSNGDDSCNTNGDDDANTNGDNDANTNGDDDSNTNGDDNSNFNGDDNSNSNGDDSSHDTRNDNGDDSGGHGGGSDDSGGNSGSGGGGGGDD